MFTGEGRLKQIWRCCGKAEERLLPHSGLKYWDKASWRDPVWPGPGWVVQVQEVESWRVQTSCTANIFYLILNFFSYLQSHICSLRNNFLAYETDNFYNPPGYLPPIPTGFPARSLGTRWALKVCYWPAKSSIGPPARWGQYSARLGPARSLFHTSLAWSSVLHTAPAHGLRPFPPRGALLGLLVCGEPRTPVSVPQDGEWISGIGATDARGFPVLAQTPA